MRKQSLALLIVCLFATLAPTVSAQSGPLHVVASMTIIADVAQNVGGDLVDVSSLVPFDSDVHAFQPTPADVVTVARADVLLVSGAGLETFLQPLLENVPGVEPVVVSDGIAMRTFGTEEGAGAQSGSAEATEQPPSPGVLGVDTTCGSGPEATAMSNLQGEEADEYGGCDPHVWTDPANVKIWADNIAAAFAAADPSNADNYRANAAAYKDQLDALGSQIQDIVSTIPAGRRVLVTSHDFLGYFAARYGFAILPIIPGGSTLSEPTPQDIAALVDTIKAASVPAIFTEVSFTGPMADVVASETGVQIVTQLYSGSLSPADGPAATYLDYMLYNARTIVDALGK